MKYLSAEAAIQALIFRAEEYEHEFELLADAEAFSSEVLGILNGFSKIAYKEEVNED